MNFETERHYQMIRSGWTVRRMRLLQLPRRPPTRPVVRRVADIEGFEAYLSVTDVRSPQGDYKRELIVIPALNYFDAVSPRPNGQTVTAVNIRLGAPHDHNEFLPPPGAVVAEQEGFGGFMVFAAVVVRIDFPNRPPLELTTTEETPLAVRTPGEDELSIVTTIVDNSKKLVRIRVMKNVIGRRGNFKGDVLDEVHVALGETATTTKLVENFAVSLKRVGGLGAR